MTDSSALSSPPATTPAAPHRPEPPVIVLEPRAGWQPINFREIWEFHELFFFLALRDVQVRYKQTFLGILWAVIQPLFNMLVFTIFFGKLAGFQKASDIPYPVLTFTALLPWQLFATALSNAGTSLISNQNLLTKVYFPRLAIPVSTVLAGLVDFSISFVVLLLLMAVYGVMPGLGILLLPVFILLAVVSALGVGLWLSALAVTYRDVRYTLPFLVQIWMFCSPVIYLSNRVPTKWLWVYALNPMVGVIEGFRWALLKTTAPAYVFFISGAVSVVLLIGGLFYFRRTEKFFADRI